MHNILSDQNLSVGETRLEYINLCNLTFLDFLEKKEYKTSQIQKISDR